MSDTAMVFKAPYYDSDNWYQGPGPAMGKHVIGQGITIRDTIQLYHMVLKSGGPSPLHRPSILLREVIERCEKGL